MQGARCAAEESADHKRYVQRIYDLQFEKHERNAVK